MGEWLYAYYGLFFSSKNNGIQIFAVTFLSKGFPVVVQRFKRLPGMQETWVRSLGREDPLEKEMVTHSSTLAWRIPWTEKPGRLQSLGWEGWKAPLEKGMATHSSIVA